jgi:hypothetical protein
MKKVTLTTVLAITVVLAGGLLVSAPAIAGDWSINLWGGSPGYVYPAPGYVQPAPTYYYNTYPRPIYRQGYYPQYNPIMRRDVYNEGGYAPDGTYHGETTVEDRRASYYSPGRNQAITQPQTSVQNWSYGPGAQGQRETTRWIGADGRPHSTTIDRNTYIDPFGNTQTDTHVTLKRKQVGQQSGSTNQTQTQTTPPVNQAAPGAQLQSSPPSAAPAQQ